VKTWFTADTHFGLAGAIGIFKRPFRSVAEMDDAIIARWNEVVAPADKVWHLGDFAIGATRLRIANLLKQLNGTKYLIIGNNDGAATTHAVGWENVEHYADIAYEDVRLILCHYPFRTWDGISKGSYNLHGHSHGRLTPLRRQVDVGVDVWEFRPVSLDVLRTRRAAKRPRRH
jgi:calcineurin-like phosphoesterase family protein